MVCTSFLQAKGQHKIGGMDSIVYAKLMKMDFKRYVNRPGNLFFKDLKHKYRKATPAMQKPGFIHRVRFSFSDSLSLEIRVRNLGQKERLNFNYKFRPEIFLSKKVEWICLKYAGECIKGCEELDCD